MRPHFFIRLVIVTLVFCVAGFAQNPTASITVDVNAGRRAIDPRV
jgi:hypothetical protein